MTPLPTITFVSNIYPSQRDPGRGTFVRNSLVELRSQGRNVDVVTLDRTRQPLAGYVQFYVAAMRRLARDEGIAYVHYVSHSAVPVVVAKACNRRLRVALHFHGSDAFPESYEGRVRTVVKRLICRVAIAGADTIVAPSAPFADRLRTSFRIPDGQVVVSPSAGVDRSIFAKGAHGPRDGKRVVFAGRMIEGKGAVEAARALRDAFDEGDEEMQATFVGEGPERDQAEAILRTEVDSGTVTFEPPVDQVRLAEIFQQADILLFPSTREGESLGLVLIEAIFCGAVPIAFDNSTTRSILGGVESAQLLAQDQDDFEQILATLRSTSPAELRSINDELISINERFDSKSVARELSQTLR